MISDCIQQRLSVQGKCSLNKIYSDHEFSGSVSIFFRCYYDTNVYEQRVELEELQHNLDAADPQIVIQSLTELITHYRERMPMHYYCGHYL